MQSDEVGRRSPRPAREPSHPDPPQVTLVRSFGDNDHHDLIDWSDYGDLLEWSDYGDFILK